MLPSLFACGTGTRRSVQVASNLPVSALLVQLAPERSEDGFRIPVPQPNLTNLNLLLMVGGLVRFFLFTKEMNPDFLAFRCV